MTEREVWLISIEMPKEIMDDIREGSIDLAGQTIDLNDLDEAYDDDLDKEGEQGQEDQEDQEGQGMGAGLGGPMSAGQPALPGGM